MPGTALRASLSTNSLNAHNSPEKDYYYSYFTDKEIGKLHREVKYFA